MKPVSSYAVDLLMAAKLVAHPPVNAGAVELDAALQQLQQAVIAFEAAMPTNGNGVVLESA